MNKTSFIEIIETISENSQELYNYIDKVPENSLALYLKLNFLKINEYYNNYILKVETLIHLIKKIQIEDNSFKKLIEFEIINILKSNKEIYHLLYSIYLKIQKDQSSLEQLSYLFKKNERSLKILVNMSYSYNHFNYTLDTKKIKKIDYSDLKYGDIVLTIQENITFFSDPLNWLILKITRSNIVHATIYCNKNNGNYYFFDTITNNFSDYIDKDIFYHKLKKNYSQNSIGLVLRLKKNLSKTQKIKIDEYFKLYNGRKYGLFKALNLALLLKLFYYFPNEKYLENRGFKNTSYCSETVVLAYENAKIILSIKEDTATITPVDLLNSDKLEIIGHIDKPQK